MSESFPFGQPATAAPAAETEGGRDKRTVLVGGVLAAAVLAGSAFFFLGGSDAPADDFVSPLAGAAPVAAPAEVPVEAAVVPAALPAEAADPGRNPFRALYVEPVEAPPPDPEAVQEPALGSGSTPLTGGGASTGSGTVTGLSPDPTAAPTVYELRLDSVNPLEGEVRTTSWSYDGTTAEGVLPGQRFGKYGELVVLAYVQPAEGQPVDTVLLQVGDDKPFTVTVGQPQQVL